jgi:hypothetical protein
MYGPNPKKYEAHVYAIVRFDYFHHDLDAENVENAISITKVVWDMDTAQAEVARLNEVNKDKDCIYFWQTTRLQRRDASNNESKRTSPPDLRDVVIRVE